MRTSKVLVIAALSIVLILGCSFVLSNSSDEPQEFVILHTNDTHCHYDDQLGFTTLKSLKDQMEADGKIVFTIDAGDFLQGNAYGTMTEGESSIGIMNSIGYDVGVPGNHEFDYTFTVMMDRVSQLNFPLICANLYYTDQGGSVFPQYMILEKGNIRLGCFGILTPETPVATSQGKMENTTVTDAVEAAERMVSLLSTMDVDYIVAIGHIGVARSLPVTSDYICSKVPGIDIFIDGHSHVEMEDGKLCDGSIDLIPSDTIIASTGSNLNTVGVITVTADGDITAKLHRDKLYNGTVEDLIEAVEEDVNTKLMEVIGHTDIYLEGERSKVRSQETNLADLIADSFRWCAKTDIAFINGGSVRTSIEEGDITLKDAFDLLPFLNDVVVMTVSGSSIYDSIEFSLGKPTPFGGFVQVSGITVTYDPSKEAGSRVVSIMINGSELDKNGTYTFATVNFIAQGGDGNIYFADYPTQMVCADIEALIQYITEIGNITESTIDGGRIVPIS